MKNITKLLVMIVAVAALAIGGTVAYFSDTETSTGNTISAGTIDISVDDQNPWSTTYLQKMSDLKPGESKTITFTMKNEGTNPAVIRKTIGNFVSTPVMNEPKCETLNGGWNQSNKTCSLTSAEDISKMILYSMKVSVNDGADATVIPESWGITMEDVKDLGVPLGTLLNAGDTMKVTQTYKLKEEADNLYQGDSLAFDIKLYAEQRLGPGQNTLNGVVLDNKTGDSDWYSVVDGTMAFFSYDSSSHSYTAKAFGLEFGKTYRLTYRTTGEPVNLATGIAAGDGTLTLTGTHDFGGATNVLVDLMYGTNLWGENLKNLWQGNATNL